MDTDDESGRGAVRAAATATWCSFLALVNAVSLRRAARGTRFGGRVVIYDRYLLDALVELRAEYLRGRPLRFQETLARFVAPSPSCAFLLDLPAEAAHARKPDWSLPQTRARAELYRAEHGRFGVQRLDAQRPPEDLTAEITLRVLTALRS